MCSGTYALAGGKLPSVRACSPINIGITSKPEGGSRRVEKLMTQSSLKIMNNPMDSCKIEFVRIAHKPICTACDISGRVMVG